jgi:hypothetical protein
MPAAISPYSIAVAPDWSAMNSRKIFFIFPGFRFEAQNVMGFAKRVPMQRPSIFRRLDGKVLIEREIEGQLDPHALQPSAISAVPGMEFAAAAISPRCGDAHGRPAS